MNLISMSLWGTGELYTQGAIRNACLTPTIYAGWTLRVYCSPESPALDTLRAMGVDVRIVPSGEGHAGLFWRFLPAGETEFDHVIVRDADSRLNVRDRAAVDAWIASGQSFHVMRDHEFHRKAPMLAGMWGCRGGSIPDIGARVARFARYAAKHDDTKFLRDEIWPLVKDRCLVHSSVPEPLGGVPFPPHPPFEGFVGEIVDPRAEARDVVAIMIPSKGRPDAALATAQSARATAAATEQLRLVVGVEPDEASDYRNAFGGEASWIHILQSGGSYVRAIRELHRSTIAGIYGLCADDFVFETPGWDNRIRKAVAELPERLGLVYGDDGIQRERLATAPFLTAEWIACVGDILPGNYQHMFCDTEITEIARLSGLLRFLPDVRIRHHHHVVGQAAFDATYERSSATMTAGEAEYQRRERERHGLADRLTKASRAPRLSILIPALVQRAGLLDELLAVLRRQLEALPDSSVVEVLVEPDAGERSIGAKRKSLLARARGRWVTFIEDEDVIAQNGAATILSALEQDPDCVTFGRPTAPDAFDSHAPKRIYAVRRSIALVVARTDGAGREDFKWSGSMSPWLKSEVAVDQPVFHHRVEIAGINVNRSAGTSGQVHRESAGSALPGFPTPVQQLLLTAALRRDGTALHAWNAWRKEVEPDLADRASTRLFPIVWWNLDRLGAAGIQVNALKPYYWRSWATSRERIQLAAEAADNLQRAGIPLLVMKGVALASRHYETPQLRSTGSVDVMVPPERIEEARRLLFSGGWRPIEKRRERALPPADGLVFEDPERRRLNVHGHAIEDVRPAADAGFWARAETVLIGGTSTRVLAPTDQLLHVCARCLQWTKGPAILWVADVMAILDSAADQLDWDLLLAEVRSRRLVMPVRKALDYVRSAFEVSALIPVCERLHALRCTISDRIDFQARLRPPSHGRTLVLHWLDQFSRLRA